MNIRLIKATKLRLHHAKIKAIKAQNEMNQAIAWGIRSQSILKELELNIELANIRLEVINETLEKLIKEGSDQ